MKAEALTRIQELTAGEEAGERVRLSDFFAGSLDSEQTVDQAIEQLRGHLLKLLAEKVKIIVGGAPVTQGWANEIGADAFGADAVDGKNKIDILLGR